MDYRLSVRLVAAALTLLPGPFEGPPDRGATGMATYRKTGYRTMPNTVPISCSVSPRVLGELRGRAGRAPLPALIIVLGCPPWLPRH